MKNNGDDLDVLRGDLLAEAERLTEVAHELWHEGRFAETEPLYRRALSIRELR